MKKALIWIGCMFLGALVNLVLDLRPSVLVFVGTIALATFLCKKVDNKAEKT